MTESQRNNDIEHHCKYLWGVCNKNFTETFLSNVLFKCMGDPELYL